MLRALNRTVLLARKDLKYSRDNCNTVNIRYINTAMHRFANDLSEMTVWLKRFLSSIQCSVRLFVCAITITNHTVIVLSGLVPYENTTEQRIGSSFSLVRSHNFQNE